MLELKDRIYSVGVQNADLRVFDIIMRTPRAPATTLSWSRETRKPPLWTR